MARPKPTIISQIKINGEQTTIRLPLELMEQLKQKAERRGYTIKDLIIFILREYFAKSIVQE